MELNDVGRLLMSMTRKMKKTASQIVHPLTQLEKWLKEATSNTNWGCSSTILNEIARSMTDYHDYVLVQKCIGDCLSEKAIKWRRIFKTLVLVEYLLKNGIDRFVDDFKEYMYKIRHLQDFYYTEEGKDKGAGIREKSKYILNLMNDPLLLKSERKKARDNRGKYIGINGRSGIVGTGGVGGGFIGRSNCSITSTKFNNNKSASTSISSCYSVTSSGINASRIAELYDPYCHSSSNKDEDYSSSRAGSNVSDGLDVIKNAGIAGSGGEANTNFSETTNTINTSVKLPGPPSYSNTTYRGTGARRAPMGGGGNGIRRVEVAKDGHGFPGNGTVWISDESILNAAQKLARDSVMEGREDEEEDLQWSDWNSFVAAEAATTKTGSVRREGGAVEGSSLNQRGGIISGSSKCCNAPSLNPFESDCLGLGAGDLTQMEIERRKKIMNESIVAGDLLDLNYSCNSIGGEGEEGAGFGFGFSKGTESEEYVYYDNSSNGFQQENGGASVGNSSNIHIPYGF
ncbi:epsin like ENTH VHS domain involved in endocytosis vesicular trafficking [Cryptosporidium sp. chipmunk genotype I]|uniref:epsin like ENTH VHS domain involved in endocytosis vesicular trafficking n=1 Tax=Cryptosporidium sp. chipmunk genotype I TaxID=1280935 RepID=UPI00351A48F1|nr:epsin like ENTH VHS domain involved in endocytosis vesicular trafficking [Cryptosporidium sp. chipmunk genotype I]